MSAEARPIIHGMSIPTTGVSIRTLDGKLLATITPETIWKSDSTIGVGALDPISFSPNGRRIALEGWMGNEHILIADQSGTNIRWVTRNLIMEKLGSGGRFYHHEAGPWSPDGQRLPVITTITGRLMLSVAEGDSLRGLLSWPSDADYDGQVRMAWSADGSTLYAAPSAGHGPWVLVRLGMAGAAPETVFASDRWISALAWNPSGNLLAVSAGGTVWMFDGVTFKEVYKAPAVIQTIYWSPDGSAIGWKSSTADFGVVNVDGSDPWNVHAFSRQSYFIPAVAWLDKERFAFILVDEEPEGIKLYVGNRATKGLKRVPTGPIPCASIKAVGEGVLYFKIMGLGAWVNYERRGGVMSRAGREREVKLDLYYWNGAKSEDLRLTRDVFETRESDGDWANFYPVIWVSGKQGIAPEE